MAGRETDQARAACPEEVVTRLYTDFPAGAVYLASPDEENLSPQRLPFSVGHDETGNYLELVQPALAYWNMIFLR